MAKQWGSSRIGQNNHSQPYFTQNKYRETGRLPGLTLHNYHGPYNQSMLSQARDELSYYVRRAQGSVAWDRILQKTDVNINGASYFDDGFGQSSCAFSHAGLHENEVDDMNQTDSDMNPQISISKNSNIKPTETVTSAVEPEVEVDLTEQSDTANSSNSDCVVFEDDICFNLESKPLVLESDGLEIIEVKEEPDGIIIGDRVIAGEETEGPFAERKELDNKTHGQCSEFDYGNTRKQTCQGQKLTIKCDICDFSNDTASIVQQHLNEAVHFAASEYSVDKEGNMSLTRKLILQNFRAKFKTVLVICPDCFKVFPDIHSCAAHNNLQHHRDNETDKYGLIHVIHEDVCNNYANVFKCKLCSKSFNGCQGLTRHIKDFCHYPFTNLKNCNKVFFCCYCKTSFNSFEEICYHQDHSHQHLVKNSTPQFTVFHYNKVKCHYLLRKTHTLVGTGKRKHDGISTEMEQVKKIASAGTNKNIITRCGSSSNTTGMLSNSEVESYSQRVDNSADLLKKQSPDDDDDSKPDCALLEIFRCDYCQKMVVDETQMNMHLFESFHSSASTYLVDHQGNIMYLRAPTSVSCYEAKFKRVVATCIVDTCRRLFDSPFVCGDHNVAYHNSKESYYHLADIVARTTITESLSSKTCAVCKQSFQKYTELNDHYTRSNHFPFQTKGNCNIYILCEFCKRTFTSYKIASSHVRTHVKFAKNDQLHLVVLYISKTAKMVTIPPYEPTQQGEVTSIRSKISNLHGMKKYCGKSGRSQINKQIKNMKQYL